MDNSLNDDRYREAYTIFSTEHIQQKDALMDAIANIPVPHSQFLAPPQLSLWQRIPRRSWILIAATVVVVVLATFMPSLLEITPANVLADGWHREYVISENDIDAATDNTAEPKIEVWTEDGWLIVRRKSATDEVEWQVVLAESKAAEEPKVTQSSSEFEVTFGNFSIKESSSGELKVVRQRKSANTEWPSLSLSEGKSLNSAGNLAGIQLAASEINNWIWVTSGLRNGDQRDVWLRLAPRSTKSVNRGSKNGWSTLSFFYGPYTANDDGRTFKAARMTITSESSKPE